MPVSWKHKAVFVHIPKTGGQSISKMLGIGKNARINFYADGLTHMTLPMIEAATNPCSVDLKDKFLFTFVRDPYTKIISEFHWRMLNILSAVYNEPTRKKMPFVKYMQTLWERWDYVMSDDTEFRTRAHVIPQYLYMDDRLEVFRYEDFAASCDVIKKRLGIQQKTPHVNRGYTSAQHTPLTIDIVNRLYEKDFELLGYEIK